MRKIAEVEVQLKGKTRSVIKGYRPTLLVGGSKLLCNFDSIHPNPLRPTDVGRATIRVWWEGGGKMPLVPGAKLAFYEGDRLVGGGVVTKLVD